ncbi:MAG: YbjN domain-containing protein [Alphaproteobacteria bacterium]
MRLLASKFLATSLLSAALAIAAAGTASAAGATWTSFDTKRLSTLLKTMGAQSIEVKRATEGKVTVEAVLFNSGDTRYMAMPTVCRANGCLGLSLTVYWTNELKLTADIVNAFNEVNEFGRAFITDDGKTVGFGRYAIADGGVSEENVASNIANVVGNAGQFLKFANEGQVIAMRRGTPGVTALMSARPGAGWASGMQPMAARAINMGALNDPRRIFRPLAPPVHTPVN